MGLKILKVESEDFPNLVRLERDSFETPLDRVINLYNPCGESETEREASLVSLAQRQASWDQADPTGTWVKATDDTTGDMLGAAYWHVFHDNPYPVGMLDGVDCGWFEEGEEREIANAVMRQFLAPRSRSMQRPHVFLDICFTAPTARRRGVGGLLVEYGVELADSYGYDMYLDATEVGRNLYRKYGFIEGDGHEVHRESLPCSGWTKELGKKLCPLKWWPMYRPVGGVYQHGKTIMPWDV